VRRWKKAGVLSPPRAFGWQWTINGDVTGSIKALSETGRVTLIYSHRETASDRAARKADKIRDGQIAVQSAVLTTHI